MILKFTKSIYASVLRKQSFIKQVSGAAGFQALQLIISASIGFLIVRYLSKENYAFFNLLLSGSLFVISLSSIPLTSIYIPFSHRIGNSISELRSTTTIFRKLSFPLFLVGLTVAMVFCLVSGYRNGWLNPVFFVGLFLALFASCFQYFYRYPESAYKVSGRPLLPFRVSIASEAVRLVLILAIVLVILPHLSNKRLVPILLMSATLLAACLSYYNLTGKYQKLELQSTSVTPGQKKVYWDLLRPLLFPSYFYQASQFIRAWLIYFLSGSSVIAEAAAVGRLMSLYALMDKTVELIILPKLGAIKDEKRFINRLYYSFLIVGCIASGFLLSAWLFPGLWLWLLGAKYSNLGGALLWAVAAAGVERLSGLVLFAQLARGETKNQWWVPLFADVVYMSFVAIIGLGTAERATIAIFLGAFTNLMAQIGIFSWRLHKNKKIDKTIQNAT